MKKTFQQMRESLLLGEAVMDQKTWDKTKKGDKLTIGFDSGIKKGNKVTFVVGTKNIVGKAKVGKITMKREDGKGGKFFLYNRNGNISLALGDMAASMTSMVKEEVELDEAKATKLALMKQLEKDFPKFKVGKIADVNKVAKFLQTKGFKSQSSAMAAAVDFENYKKGQFKESVELDERNYAKEYANYHSRPEQIANRSSRNQARRIMAKDNDVEGMDVGHKDNNPLNNDPKNLQVEDPSDNRREPRMRNEGTWAIPDTPKKKAELKKLLSKPIKAKGSSDRLYSLVGDDELADDLDDFAKKHPNHDVRPMVKSAMERLGIKEDLDEGKQAKYPLYHKDFSGAMKTAYDHAKKNLGVIVDPSEIDDKVAMGPKKPSTGKTNSYRLTDKSGKKAIQVQVYNTGKSYELNMYKEDLDEAMDNKKLKAKAKKTFKDIKAGKYKGVKVSEDKTFEPHMMYDPKTGEGKKAEVEADHLKMKKMGWSHEKPKMKESVELDLAEGFSPAQIDRLRKQYKSLPDRLSTDQAMKLGKFLKGMPKDQLIAIARGDIKWLSSSAVTTLIMQGVKASEINEEVQLDEAFKAGGLKLKDGKQVLVKKDDAMMLNDLMKQLSRPNVKKMTDTLMKNKKGYAEILGFAKDSHE